MRFLLLCVAITLSNFTFGQLLTEKPAFSRADTLRGSITPERSWWDLQYYHLKIRVNPEERLLSGSNVVKYKVIRPQKALQIDLQPPLVLDSVLQDGKRLNYYKDGPNAHFIQLQRQPVKGTEDSLTLYYSGKPREAIRAPWDGGVSWKKDANGKHWVATSCQGLGASVWWPCKDHMYDEPDQGMRISITVPDDLMNVSNGRLEAVQKHPNKTATYTWRVVSPINNYGVNMNIGDYVHFGETYAGEKGPLTMDYYVLRDHLETAKEHFKDAPRMMKAFEHWFGPYPFYEDGYKLVEVPYLGMEHQSSVTYGNQFKKGYLGRDLSGTGVGLLWDFIIIHESGHEWYANNITYQDIADMWIHESFTNYSETLFTEYFQGKEDASKYVVGLRKNIKNDRPIIGTYGVNHEGSGDMYYKGANMLHLIRQVVDNDDKFRAMLRGMNQEFYHKTVTTAQIESYMSEFLGIDLTPVFDQYLRDTRIPALDLKTDGKTISYRFKDTVEGFELPVRVKIDGIEQVIRVSNKWSKSKGRLLEVDKNYYILE